MTADDIIEEAEYILAEARRVERERIAREREERRDALFNATGFCALIAGSLIAVYGVALLVFRLIIR